MHLLLKSPLRIVVALALLLALVACGQKGDLVKPGAATMNVTAATR